MSKPTGRPSTYSKELADTICEQLALGYSIRTICDQKGMPAVSTFFKWIREHDEFSKQYARAKEEATDAMAEDLLDIADNATNDYMMTTGKDGHESYQLNGEHIQRSRVRIDTRKWLMAKMKPKKYGEKLDMTTDGEKLNGLIVINKNTSDDIKQ